MVYLESVRGEQQPKWHIHSVQNSQRQLLINMKPHITIARSSKEKFSLNEI